MIPQNPDPHALPIEPPDGSGVLNPVTCHNLIFEALTGIPSFKPRPVRPTPEPIPPQSALTCDTGELFELVVAASSLAFFVLSADRHTCLVCCSSGADMSRPDEHRASCSVARLWKAIDALRITKGGC